MSKATLVLGASSELGRAVIRRLVLPSDEIVLAHCRSSSPQLEALVESRPAGAVRTLKADLATRSGAEQLAKQVHDSGAQVLRLVHLPAPKLRYIRFKDLEIDAFELEYAVQVQSVITLLRRVLPQMVAARHGRVVFVLSSVLFGRPPAAMAHYVTAKFALLGLMRALASEYCDRGITFNAVSPSMVRTPLLSEIPEKFIEIATERSPLKRLLTPDEVAAQIVRFLDDDAAFMTGINLPLTGGESF